MLQTAYPVYLALLNHTSEARNSVEGKRLITMFHVPARQPGESIETYRMATRALMNRMWEAILYRIYLWRDGLLLQLPGVLILVAENYVCTHL